MKYDVIVMGGGPSGSAAATVLGQAGARVLLLEREVFPRFHIGESLLPVDMQVFDRLGVDLTGDGRHLVKEGAEFFDEAAGLHATYPFAGGLAGTYGHAWQVDRATFDLRLLRGAATAGVEVHEGERVVATELAADRVRVRSDKGAYAARYVMDATGQDAFLARQHKTKRAIKDFGLAACFRHYEDLRPSAVERLEAQGNILILFIDHGWMWAIPLGEGRLSVGLVTRKPGVKDDWLDAHIAASPTLSGLVEGASPRPTRRLASFSFHNDLNRGGRWVCIGDAACFLDPMFSSGVSFGMVGSAHAADVLVEGLAEGREGAVDLMDEHAEWMNEAYTVFATLIRSLYRRRLVPDLFFTEEQDSLMRQGVTSVLAGDVWRDDNLFQSKLMASRRRVFDPSVAA